jgi:hypothetical protein
LEKTDTALADWIGARRVELILRLPPLRPALKAAPPTITATYIEKAKFAKDAGVGLLWGSQKLEIVDLSNGRRIFHKDASSSGFPGDLSSNGRLYLYNDGPMVALKDSESGETITRVFSNMREFFWLDKRSAIYVNASDRRSMLIDFHSGSRRRIDFLQEPIQNLGVLPNRPGQFVAFTRKSVMLLEIDYRGADPEIRLVSAKPFIFQNAFRYPGAISSDGKYYVSLSGNIGITSTDTLDTDVVNLTPFSAQQAAPLSRGDNFLISGSLPNSNNGAERFVYSISGRTIAHVKKEKLAATWVASLTPSDVIAAITSNSISFLSELPTGPAAPVQEFVESMGRAQKAQVSGALGEMGIQSGSTPVVIKSGGPDAIVASSGAPRGAKSTPSGSANASDLTGDYQVYLNQRTTKTIAYRCNSLIVYVNGGGSLNGDVYCNLVTLSAYPGTSIAFQGTVASLDAKQITGDVKLYMNQLRVEKLHVGVFNGSSLAYFQVSKSAQIDMVNSGSTLYIRSPGKGAPVPQVDVHQLNASGEIHWCGVNIHAENVDPSGRIVEDCNW